jgi:hypothetical protein
MALQHLEFFYNFHTYTTPYVSNVLKWLLLLPVTVGSSLCSVNLKLFQRPWTRVRVPGYNILSDNTGGKRLTKRNELF